MQYAARNKTYHFERGIKMPIAKQKQFFKKSMSLFVKLSRNSVRPSYLDVWMLAINKDIPDLNFD